ncbi:MAG TPA: hypothetical protein VF391_10280, partial [Dermatophilaceae bacterium]
KSVADRSYVASVDRPVDASGQVTVFRMVLPLVRFLSRHGISYDVTTDSSLDATPRPAGGSEHGADRRPQRVLDQADV